MFNDETEACIGHNLPGKWVLEKNTRASVSDKCLDQKVSCAGISVHLFTLRIKRLTEGGGGKRKAVTESSRRQTNQRDGLTTKLDV